MSNEIVEVLNQETGERGQMRRKWFEHPRINNGILIEVDASQKPYVPELYHSKIPTDSAVDEIEDEDDNTPDNEEEDE